MCVSVLGVEMLLFGTGPTVIPVPQWIKSYISSLGIQIDIMSTVRPLRSRPLSPIIPQDSDIRLIMRHP